MIPARTTRHDLEVRLLHAAHSGAVASIDTSLPTVDALVIDGVVAAWAPKGAA